MRITLPHFQYEFTLRFFEIIQTHWVIPKYSVHNTRFIQRTHYSDFLHLHEQLLHASIITEDMDRTIQEIRRITKSSFFLKIREDVFRHNSQKYIINAYLRSKRDALALKLRLDDVEFHEVSDGRK